MASSSSPIRSPVEQRHIALDLNSHWFATKPPKFPYPALRDAGPILSAYYTWEYIETLAPTHGTYWTLIGAVQWEDDDNFVTKIRVRWNSADIDGTMRGEYKHIRCGNLPVRTPTQTQTQGGGDAGRPRSADELSLAAEWYGRHVAQFCEREIGFAVGDGECWSLAAGALAYARNQALKEGHDPPMLITGRVHGQCILDWTTGSGVDAKDAMAQAGVCPGDILEMADAHFRSEKVVLGLVKQMTNVRMRRHTAVILGTVGDTGRTKLSVGEQNTKVASRVIRGEYEFGDMVAGTVKIYRPIGESNVSPQVNLKKMCEEWLNDDPEIC